MPNTVKFSTSSIANSTLIGNVAFGYDGFNYGPSNTTGWYQGVTPPSGGYVVYATSASQIISATVASNDAGLIIIGKQFTGQTFTSSLQAQTYLNANGFAVATQTYTASNAPSGTVFTSATSSNTTVVSLSPFSGGGNSYSLNGVNSYLSLPGNTSWALGTSDFTIEWFQYQTDSSPYPRIFAIGSYPATSIGCSIETGTFYAWFPNANSYGTVSVKNAWHHFAIVKRSNNLYVYLDGTQISTAKANTSNITDATTTLYLGVESGGNSGTWYGGYLTNFRLVKGLAVYTGNFTKPTSALTLTAGANPYGGSNTQAIPDGYTKLLLVP